MTVDNRKYYVYRYDAKLNGVENTVVLIIYPFETFLNLKTLRAFIRNEYITKHAENPRHIYGQMVSKDLFPPIKNLTCLFTDIKSIFQKEFTGSSP